jgi:hypothetical protein
MHGSKIDLLLQVQSLLFIFNFTEFKFDKEGAKDSSVRKSVIAGFFYSSSQTSLIELIQVDFRFRSRLQI